MTNGNGSWTGRDPRLRLLRTVAGFVLLALLAYTIIEPGHDELTTVGSLVGALLVVLGFEASVRLPGGGPK